MIHSLIYTDAITFGRDTAIQEVRLVTLVKDALFLYPRTAADGSDQTLSLEMGFGDEAIYI
ncbi:hypothetical protein [Maribacter polysaccharolyticus]|uniref:hypothetical protein n=1 Tax=Maribacter polysaccharolyticus TaxID=3020831 RepID=UPI00237F685A|nr:hypothetical protein [Maribacter polysaccharolyticus]MDE3740622.1 hypothetical protein [Maribacter polysaccharolyticus]